MCFLCISKGADDDDDDYDYDDDRDMLRIASIETHVNHC
jgi:hypothetical protein